MAVKFIIPFFAIILQIVHGELFAGDSCVINETGTQGVCTLITSCPQALQDLQRRKIPETCGFDGKKTIVCCPQIPKPPSSASPPRQPGDISRQKCREYSKYVFEKRKSPLLLFDSEETLINRCGHRAVELVVGGEVAKRREFPHMAALGYDTPIGIQWLCGGTIISEQYILTAGHCLEHRDFGTVKHVQLGVTTLTDTRHRERHSILEYIKHPEYTTTHYNDIALLKLDRSATMNSFARPACLYTSPEIKARRAIASGWGAIDAEGTTTNDLMKVTLNLIDNNSCNNTYKSQISRRLREGIVEELQLCAGTPAEKKDTCQGDSGGPLQIYHIGDDIPCMYDIVGVTSFGKGCGTSVAIYTRISSYIKWIEDTVWPQ